MRSLPLDNFPIEALLLILEKMPTRELCRLRRSSTRINRICLEYRYPLIQKRKDEIYLELAIEKEGFTFKANNILLYSPIQQLSPLNVKALDIEALDFCAPESVFIDVFRKLPTIFGQKIRINTTWLKSPMFAILNLVRDNVDVRFCCGYINETIAKAIDEISDSAVISRVRQFSIEYMYFARTLDKRLTLVWTLPAHLSSLTYINMDGNNKHGENPEQVYFLELPSKNHLLLVFTYAHDHIEVLKRRPLMQLSYGYLEQFVMMVTEKNPSAVKNVIESLPATQSNLCEQIVSCVFDHVVL